MLRLHPGDKVLVPAAQIQPIASDDVADIMAEVALGPARNGVIEISGPDRFDMSGLLARYLTATGDGRSAEASPEADYFGVKLETEYGPGGFSEAHTHPSSAFIYATVLEGAIQSQVNDGPIKTYRVGESFSEYPGDRHGVSANASKTAPARLLAVFVVDTREKELVFPIK